ncbi:MAG TPA: YqhA family protein, partial [bacterium]|nr:YqhA family protein [bacterium]
PEWLQKVDAGTLKVKLAGSLVGVSGIHLLQVFINIKNHNSEQVMWQTIIHVVFLFSAIMLAYSEKLLHEKHG